MIISLTNVTLSYPSIKEPSLPSTGEGTKKLYRASFLLPYDSKNHEDAEKVIQLVAAEKWKDKVKTVMSTFIEKNDKQRCYGRGEDRFSQKTLQPLAGYPGNFYVTSNSKEYSPPIIYNTAGEKLTKSDGLKWVTEAEKFYSGCKVNAVIDIWAQDNPHGKGIRAALKAIQFVSDGERLTSEEDLSKYFAPIEIQSAPVPDFLK